MTPLTDSKISAIGVATGALRLSFIPTFQQLSATIGGKALICDEVLP